MGCGKTVLLVQHTAKAVLAVGLRQKALPPRFLIATTASRVFPQPHKSIPTPLFRPSVTSVFKIRIRVHSCPSAVKMQGAPAPRVA
jgi:hypothetical protein